MADNTVVPTPEKGANETNDQFMARCMSDERLMVKYPNAAERAAFCFRRAGMHPKVGGEYSYSIGRREYEDYYKAGADPRERMDNSDPYPTNRQIPLPEKTSGETDGEFMERCMTDPRMMTVYTNPSQRAAICMRQSGMRPKVGGERVHDIQMMGDVRIMQD